MKCIAEEGTFMTVRGRLIAIKLLAIQEKKPEYLKALGVRINMNKVESTDDERRKKFV